MRTPKTMRYTDLVMIEVEHECSTDVTGVPDGKGHTMSARGLVDVVHVGKTYHQPKVRNNVFGEVYIDEFRTCHDKEGVLVKRSVAEKVAMPCRKCFK